MTQDMNHAFVKALRAVLVVTVMSLTGSHALAQVTVRGNVYGGGNEADVQTNTAVNISAGQVDGNVYGGGNLGDVGNITKNTTNYNYSWKQTDGSTANAERNNTIAANANNNTGISTVNISGGTIGTEGSSGTDYTQVSHGNVFGGGKGNTDATFYCQEGMVYATSVTISAGTVYGCVYGGGEIGRVEDDTEVTISGTSNDGIKGNVFGSGKGLKTHGYSALVRGNTEVTVEGNSKIGHSVYGGGELASVGRFNVVGGSPATPAGGGGCTVTIQGSAHIGGDVFGAGKGLEPETYTYADKENMPCRMMAKSMGTFDTTNNAIWENVDDNNVWEYFATPVIYQDFLRTLALASTPTVTIGGSATIAGSVFGGGQRGLTLASVNVEVTGSSTVGVDVYGGGALADTNTGNWSLNNYEEADANNLNDGETIYELFTRTGEGTAQSPYKYSRYINSTLSTGQLYRRLPIWANATDKSSTYTTHVSLTGGTITGDAYGGGLGQKAREASGGQAALEDIEAMVYGDVKVELNGKTVGSTTTQVADDTKGCIVSRVFGCNNLNGTPKGHVKVYVWGTQSSGSGNNTIIDKYAKHSGMAPENDPTPYDVAAVYGGGNLAAYVPEDALLDYSVAANKTTVEAAKTEVYINGCSRTSIKQVYAGGNAASVSGSYVTVNSVYEIEEVFGGGNGADAYTLNSKKYLNPGANVGYYNYTHFGDSGKGTGTEEDPYQPVDNTDASTKSDRQTNYRYGSGIAETIIRGGKVHVVYGGSNKKGNISTTALSVYEGSDVTCPMSIDQTYGGGKDAPIDGEVRVQTSCAHGIRQIFGGAKNADIDNDVNLTITNGSSLHQVFGGNNTSGAINGSITVTIEEGGCEPIRIDELYLGGYLAPYSVYGYQKTGDVYDTESVSYIDEDGVTQTQAQRIPLTSGNNPKQDPRLNVISATYIGNIFGGGYQAKLVGNPYVNVNMQQGKVYVTKTETTDTESPAFEDNDGKYYVYIDGNGTKYASTNVSTEGTDDQTKYYTMLDVGTIGNVYGGGYLADVVGDTHVEIGTGRWVKEWDANGPVYESKDASDNKYTYKIKTPAVKYTEQECTSTNGSLTGAISTSTLLTAAQATRLNELLNISTYSEGNSPSSEHAEAYNATLDGYITTVDIKTPAVWAWYNASNVEQASSFHPATLARNAATITGNVFGGGYGLADATTFTCEKAMVGVNNEGADPTKRNGGTSVVIENGTVGTLESGTLEAGTGNVYGGGRLARVERNTVVTIGSESGIGTPVILGDVYGAGMGVDTHGYSGLVRGNATVTIQGASKVRGNVYGGGEMASLGRFFVASTEALATAHGVEKGMPYDLKSGGTSTVIIRGTAEIGPESGDANDNSGQVFGAGKGANPADITSPGPGRYYLDNNNEVQWESYAGDANKMALHKYILTLGITNKGNVIIDGGSTVKGSVYGGGRLGNVLSNTEVNVSAEKQTSGTTVTYVATSNQVNPTIIGDVYGGGKGLGDTFTCEKAMVGKDGAGVDANYVPTDYSDGNTTIVIGNGTVSGNVYGGGEVGRVEKNTSVTVGLNSVVQGGTSAPEIGQSVFGGGKGLETHGYSALVRGNPTVTVQASAKVRGNVYGGGQIASVARYRVAADNDEGAPYGVKAGMPYALADNNSGSCTVTVRGNAEIGPASFAQNAKTTDVGHVFGAGKGILPGGVYAFVSNTTKRMVAVRDAQGNVTDNSHEEIFTSEADYITFVKTLALASNTNVTIDGNAIVKGSVFGGSESGFVQFDTNVNVTGGTIGVQGKGGADFGNVYGGGKGDARYNGGNGKYVEAGLVKGNTEIAISETDATNHPTLIYHNIYGGGAYGTVGEFAYDANGLPTGRRTYTVGETVHNTTGGKAKITITGGTIGSTGQDNGIVFGSSRGDVGAPGEIHDRLAWVYDTEVIIGTSGATSNTSPQINGSIYGGGENGHVFHDAEVKVHSGTIGIESGSDVTVTNADQTTTTYKAYNYPNRGNVYGGGCGTDKYYSSGVADEGHTLTDGEGDKYNPLAGIVQGDATVTIDGGHVVHNVYGAGAMGSVGTITNFANLDDQDASENYLYKHVDATTDGKESYYNFGLSWPYEFTYGSNTGQTTVSISDGAVIGVNVVTTVEADKPNGGHIFGAARGAVDVGEYDINKQRYEEAKLANVRTTAVTIGTTTETTHPTIYGSVYGGGEDGHVYENATVTINKGSIAHSVFGGGKGTSTFKAEELWIADPTQPTVTTAHSTLANQDVHSWTAGRVYGNTTVTMNDGSVGYYIYGGGNMASVGKGNYAGGSDDYSTAGYGELPEDGNATLWTNVSGTDAYLFNHSGLATVNVYGGTLGIAGFDSKNDNLPYGSVFGGCRGKAAMNVGARSPRYRYVPDFFLGYVNKAVVNIGDASKISAEDYTGPTIMGSVYGGGQDGHVRNSTQVNVNKGSITGQDPSIDTQGRSGHVFGAGSGIGTYTENNVPKVSNSSGSVTCTTEVTVNDGTISGNVYGGGAMASVGPPKTPAQTDYEDKAATSSKASHSYTKVTLNGGEIVGDVYGASRGPGDAFLAQRFTVNNEIVYNPDDYATVIWSDVELSSESTAVVNGSVYGGGEGGRVKKDTKVDLLGGTIKGDAYGGGKGTLTTNIAADIGGDTEINLGSNGGSTATAFWITYDNAGTESAPVNVVKSGRIFGCNNLNGSPKGNANVTVYRTVNGYDVDGNLIEKTDEDNINSSTESLHTYEVAAVYGGGNLAPYEAVGKWTHVQIYGCDATSILTVYGGGNAASVPESKVDVWSCYEIGSLFGGGNGKDRYKNSSGVWTANPGANVGNSTHTYTGNATTKIYGGTVHEAYGGSNKKGTIYGNVDISLANSGYEENDPRYCRKNVAKLVAAGKNADVEGDLIVVMECGTSEYVPLLFAGADDANVNGNVELTLTGGNFGKVFGGNNAGGAIRGHLILNIEERDCGTPLTIDELYLGGNEAAYSQYGYYVNTEAPNYDPDNPVYIPISKEMTDPSDTEHYKAPAAGRIFTPYGSPQLNVVACTYIGKVFGGGLGTGAVIYGDPVVNINMIPSPKANGVPPFMTTDPRLTALHLDPSENPDKLGVIGDVYGGGNRANVEGNTRVNIGTESTVSLHESLKDDGVTYNWSSPQTVKGAYIVGNVFGGGKGSADTFTCEKAMIGKDGDGIDNPDGGTKVYIYKGLVKGNVYGGGEIGRVEKNTYVKIGNDEDTASGTANPVIMGNVFGGGAGVKTHGYSALVRGNPTVTIEGNAKVEKSVYGGGEIASVARYQVVNGVPVALAEVKEGQHSGYCTVTVQGYAEIGPNGMKMYHPEITNGTDKPDDWGHVFAAGKGVLPEVYLYTANDTTTMPKRMMLYKNKKSPYWAFVDKTYVAPANVDPENLPEELANQNVWEYFPTEEDYFDFLETLALATQTELTIGGHAFVKGSAYGGSENGTVQYNTNVTIQGNCQIGQGKEITTRYEDYTGGSLFDLTTPPIKSGSGSTAVYYDLECESWDYGKDTDNDGTKDLFAPYDPNANATDPLDKYPAVGTATAKSTEGGRRIASDGHTYYGNVFGGGSGSVPYFDTSQGISRYIMTAGQVKGNTNVTINGGHILTNVYGGCEATNVLGKATVTMTAGTLGVPRTLAQIEAHPVTCYLFGAGKGDQRIFFNKDTNVEDVEVKIIGGKIFGSVFGGGEDGHVLRDVTMTIGADGVGDAAPTGPTIGNWGTSYVDGNIFGGGRGFSGDAYTAGNVAGSITMDIKGGSMLGSVYGGGRLGSVGYELLDVGQPGYGEMQADVAATAPVLYTAEDDIPEGKNVGDVKTPGTPAFKRGYIDITISGGTIGNDDEYKFISFDIDTQGKTDQQIETAKTNALNTQKANIPNTEFELYKSFKTNEEDEDDYKYTYIYRLKHTKGGNVFAGGMGRFYMQDGKTPISNVDWWRLGNVKSTKLTITGGTIKSNVYGGGELGMVQGGTHTSADNKTVSTEINISGGTIGTEITKKVDAVDVTQYTFGSVFGGGYGSLFEKLEHTGSTNPTYTDYQYTYPKYIAGRVKGSTEVTISGSSTNVMASVYGGGEMAAVGESTVLAHPEEDDPVVLGETLTGNNGAPIEANTYVIIRGGMIGKDKVGTTYFGGAMMGNVYGGGSGHNNTVRSGHIYGNTNVTISNGTIYHNVYGGGAYGTVGDFTYLLDDETKKVDGISGLNTNHANSGVATVTITGGTIGIDGKENGMVFGSSRGDINQPNERDDHTAWVYDTHVTIGTSATGTQGQQGYVAESGPHIKGTVYGSGENGHVFHDTEVTMNGGKIGIDDENDVGYTVSSNGKSYSGAAYPYRGNVYGGGCGTDKYYSNHTIENHDGNGQLYNSLAGIVYGNATVNITGGTVVRNVYGAGAMGSVGKVVTTSTTVGETTTTTTSITSGGQTTINISGGTVGVDGTNGDGNVFGAARGDENTTQTDCSLVQNTSVNISSTADVKNNVYGGGETGDVLGDTEVNVCAEKPTSGTTYVVSTASGTPTIGGNVFGGGKGSANLFDCSKAMVGIVDQGVIGSGTTESPYVLQPGGTTVRIYNGTVNGNVYGGGEIARVERNTVVEIGAASGTTAPIIQGSVFAAGAGLETHGYSALVRGTSTVTVQGSAMVKKNVYGGGEKASVGRYKVKIKDGTPPDAPASLPAGMPYGLKAGGTSYVNILGNATIGTDNVATTGHVYGAGKGIEPTYVYNGTYTEQTPYTTRITNSKRMANYSSSTHTGQKRYTEWDYYNDDTNSGYVWEYFTTKDAYLQFIETLAISASTDVTINGTKTTGYNVMGSVFGGSESGFVYQNTDVKIQGGIVKGDAFGGGLGLESFAEAGRVRWNTNLAVSGGAVQGNVYGGGKLGDVGTIDKRDPEGKYNYFWKNSLSNGNTLDADHNNTPLNNTITSTESNPNTNTGICTVSISGGEIGLASLSSTDKPEEHGNVFGAGRGSSTTWWCEKAIVFATNVSVSKGTVNGNVYGGGEVGRVEDDAKVTIGTPSGTDNLTITGSVYGAGAGLATHGYSALVRGNADVIVQGSAQIGGSVYGGGEIASVGKFTVPNGLPKDPLNGGTCKVIIQGNAKIGTSGITHNVFGACKGVTPAYNNTVGSEYRSKSMQLRTNAPENTDLWDPYNNDNSSLFIWRYYATEDDYLDFLKTLALTSNTHVTIGGSSEVYGSVYGGGERGITLGGTDVNMTSGTVFKDFYGGGALADTNTSMWDADQSKRLDYVTLPNLIAGSPATGYYTAKSANALITDPAATVQSGTTYYAIYKTNVNLLGGKIVGNAYGGGLGSLGAAAIYYSAEEATAYNSQHNLLSEDPGYVTTETVKTSAVAPIEAKVYGDVLVELNNNNNGGDANGTKTGCIVNQVFGCNNLNGSPQGHVKVHVFATQSATTANISTKARNRDNPGTNDYDVKAVYGGGNLAKYEPVDPTPSTPLNDTEEIAEVIIDGCNLTSIGTVYGGGNAASVPATEVTVNGTYEIGKVFGGGNGDDAYEIDGKIYQNPGANVGLRNYTHLGTGAGTVADPILAVNNTDPDASTKGNRETNYGYGLGKTHATIYGGTVHAVYGGSNKRGNVRVESRTTLEDLGCNFTVGDAYGGGNNAPQDGDAVLEIGCIGGMEKAYGGAADADINGNVVLNITNGTYGQVFGGNDAGGAIRGSITVNIEETGCKPVIIGELYGGGCNAAYSVYGYDADGNVLTSGSNPVADPVVNVKSFTSIGSIFGGGYGAPATMVGNPQVNINVTKGKYSDQTSETYFTNKGFVLDAANKRYSKVVDATDNPHTVYVPTHEAGKIGAIYNVFGGGNAADVIGTPHVNIGTLTGEVITLVSQKIEDSEGRTPSDANWIPSYQLATVEGVDIRDNVYGAGNNANVTGDAEVVIGKNNAVKTYSFTSYGTSSGGTPYSTGLAQTTGVTKNNLSEVVILTNGKYGDFVGRKYYVDSNVKADGSEITQLKDADGNAISLYVAIKPFEQKKTYNFTSWSAQTGGTQYSTGTAAPTGNFKTFDSTEYMQIVVLTNPGETSWEGKTFYVPTNAKTDGTRTQLCNASGSGVGVWVVISEEVTTP